MRLWYAGKNSSVWLNNMAYAAEKASRIQFTEGHALKLHGRV